MKNRKITGLDVGIVCSAIGMIASIVTVIINLMIGDSIIMGIMPLICCTVNLFICTNEKKNRKDK